MRRLLPLVVVLAGCAETTSLVPPNGSPPVGVAEEYVRTNPPVASPLYARGEIVTEVGGYTLAAGVIATIVDFEATPCTLGVSCSTQKAVDDANTATGVIAGFSIGAIVTGTVMLAIGIPMMIIARHDHLHPHQAFRGFGFTF